VEDAARKAKSHINSTASSTAMLGYGERTNQQSPSSESRERTEKNPGPQIIGAATLFFVLAMIRELQPNESGATPPRMLWHRAV
jgi:hypothetical protein